MARKQNEGVDAEASGAPQSDADTALALMAEVEALKAQLADANTRAESTMRKVAEQERELSSLRGEPVLRGPRITRAKHIIRCHDAEGAPLTLKPGDAVPEGAKLEGVGSDALEEV